MTRLATGCAVLLLLGLLAACNDEAAPPADDPLVVTLVAGGATVSADAPVELTITITNNGDEILEWGSGSSSCRLFARVTVDGADHPVPAFEICTADMVTYTLDPGASDTQTKTWDGTIGRDGEPEPLPVGTYEIHGLGGETTSEHVTIEVVR